MVFRSPWPWPVEFSLHTSFTLTRAQGRPRPSFRKPEWHNWEANVWVSLFSAGSFFPTRPTTKTRLNVPPETGSPGGKVCHADYDSGRFFPSPDPKILEIACELNSTALLARRLLHVVLNWGTFGPCLATSMTRPSLFAFRWSFIYHLGLFQTLWYPV